MTTEVMTIVIQVILLLMLIVSFIGVIAERDKDLRLKLAAITISLIIALVLMPVLSVIFL